MSLKEPGTSLHCQEDKPVTSLLSCLRGVPCTPTKDEHAFLSVPTVPSQLLPTSVQPLGRSLRRRNCRLSMWHTDTLLLRHTEHSSEVLSALSCSFQPLSTMA